MGMTLLPADAGSCHFCATEHGPDDPHNYWSLFYQTRFKMSHGRDATHADAVAHLPEQSRQIYREVLAEHRIEWNEPDGGPVVEPYVESNGLTTRTAKAGPLIVKMGGD